MAEEIKISNWGKSSSVIDNLYNKYFKYADIDIQKALNIFSLYIFCKTSKNKKSASDLHKLGEILDRDSLVNMIDFFDGDTLELPSVKEYEHNLFITVSYFLRKVGMEWSEIREFLGYSKKKFSTVYTGKQLKILESDLDKQLEIILANLTRDTVNAKVLKQRIMKAISKGKEFGNETMRIDKNISV
jgi:hypothetical protein